MTTLVHEYEIALGIQAAGDRKERIEAALKRAYEIRQFEIDLYWKRSGYFWLFQAAVLTAIGLFWRRDASVSLLLPIGLASLGTLTALACAMVADGSKFWQANWEKHIDMLETLSGGSLYRTVWIGRNGVRWSVSRVNQRLNWIFVQAWLALLLASAVKSQRWREWTFGLDACFDRRALPVVLLLSATAVAARWLLRTASELHGPAFLAGKNGEASRTDLPKVERPHLFGSDTEADRLLKRATPGDIPEAPAVESRWARLLSRAKRA